MTNLHTPEDDNEQVLNTLVRSLTLSRGRFSLILVRCNYADLQQAMQQRLRELCSFEIRELVLPESAKTLYTAIKEEIGNEQPDALMVLGLEAVTDLDELLSATNQVRDEFRKGFAFPIVLWVNNEVLRKLAKVAPDFNSWTGIPIHFTITAVQLLEKLRQNAERVFAAVLDAGASQFLSNCAILGASYPCELSSALRDLQTRNIRLESKLEASVEFLRGRDEYGRDQIDAALAHYQESLKFWQHNSHLERNGVVLFHIGLCWRRLAELERTQKTQHWEKARGYLQQAIDVFESAGRVDFVAKFITQLGEVLRCLEAWEDLRTLAQNSLKLHQIYGNSVQLARDNGFLAEVALKGYCIPPPKNCIEQANHFARQALQILSEVPQQEQQQRGLYELLLALSQQHLGQFQEAILTLEAAKEQINPQDNPQLYIDILGELRSLYFKQGEYLRAFRIKQEQRAIETQYGFRAFIGAGRLQPRRQAKSALGEVEPQEAIAPEIAASGRQLDVNRLMERMARNDCKLTVIHGFSGVGKSSTLTAGLVPALKHTEIGTREPLPIVLQVYTDWERVLGQFLAEALKKKTIDLSITPDSAAAIIEQVRKNEEHHLLTVLIFDQFEEFFLGNPDPAQRRHFFEFLDSCLNIPYLKIILSIREDYLHYLLEGEHLVSLRAISHSILEDILRKANRHYLGNFLQKDAELVIETLTKRTQFYLEPALIHKLVQDLAGELGEVRPIELQIVGAQLQSENITTLAQYQQKGPKAKLVERYLEKVIEDCGNDNKEIADSVLYLLTDENGIRPLKTREQIESELSVLVEKLDKLDFVLEIFVASGLVFLFPEVHTERYQLVHDYLVSFVRPEDNELQQKLAKAREKLVKEREQRKLAEAELNRVEEANQRLAEVIAELEKEREQRKRTEVELNRAEEVLVDTQDKIKRTIHRGNTGLIVISLLATAVVAWTGITTRQNLKTAQEGTSIERAGLSAWRQFESTEINALLLAIKSGQELKNLVKDGRPLEKYPAFSPLFALQTILDNIHEHNQWEVAQNNVNDVSFSPNGERLVTVAKDGKIKLWNRSGRLLRTWEGQQGAIYSVKFSPNGQRLITAGEDRTARLWDLSGQQLVQFKGHQEAVTSVDFRPDGQRIATTGKDGTVRLWNLSGQQLAQWNGKDTHGKVWNVRFHPEGRRLATTGEDGTVRLWNLSGQQLALLKGHQSAVFNVSFSPDGQRLATAGLDGIVLLWNLSGQQLGGFNTEQAAVTNVSFSPNGESLVTAGIDGSVRLLKLSQNLVPSGTKDTARRWKLSEQPIQFNGHKGRVFGVTFSPDGQYLATAGEDGTTRLWNLSPQEFEWKAYKESVNWSVVSFSPDGQYLATAGVNDSTVRFWNFSEQQQLNQLKTEQKGIEVTAHRNCVAVSPMVAFE